MPNYKKLTIDAEVNILDQKIEAIEDTDKKLKTPNIASGVKLSLEQHRTKLATEIGQAIDKVLLACDVAEGNNLAYCKYITDTHAAAKLEMAKLDPLLKKLEIAWDDKVAYALTYTIGQINQSRQKLTDDDKELRGVNMVNEYRGNGWKISVQKGLAYAPDRKSAFETREKNRQAGIQHSTQVVGHRDRVTEYVTRATAMQKTAQMLLQKAMGEKKDFAKIREECIDFADLAEKTSSEYVGQLQGTAGNMKTKVQTFLGSKAVTKESYKPVMLLEPKLDALTKEVKGKVKTLRIQLTEQMKKVSVKGMEDRYYKPQFARAEAAIKKLEAALVTFDKDIAPGRKLIAEGKKAK